MFRRTLCYFSPSSGRESAKTKALSAFKTIDATPTLRHALTLPRSSVTKPLNENVAAFVRAANGGIAFTAPHLSKGTSSSSLFLYPELYNKHVCGDGLEVDDVEAIASFVSTIADKAPHVFPSPPFEALTCLTPMENVDEWLAVATSDKEDDKEKEKVQSRATMPHVMVSHPATGLRDVCFMSEDTSSPIMWGLCVGSPFVTTSKCTTTAGELLRQDLTSHPIFSGALKDNVVFMGGEKGWSSATMCDVLPIFIMHSIPGLKGSVETAPGLFMCREPGLNDLEQALRHGMGTAQRDVLVLLGFTGWHRDDLKKDVASGKWVPVRFSSKKNNNNNNGDDEDDVKLTAFRGQSVAKVGMKPSEVSNVRHKVWCEVMSSIKMEDGESENNNNKINEQWREMTRLPK
eukprot:PhM_4_TR4174/c3_g2_i1/m.78417